MRSIPRSPAGVLFAVLLLAGIWLFTEFVHDESRSRSGSSGDATVAVDRVVDGDTARVWLDGKSESVRYIGIDTPEMNQGNGSPDCHAREATNRNDALLARNDQVRLVFDKERRDHYGRLLAYVYSGSTLLQSELLEGGYATTLEVEPNTSMAREFGELEEAAREAGRGLWSAC